MAAATTATARQRKDGGGKAGAGAGAGAPPTPGWADADAAWWERWSRPHGRVVERDGRRRWVLHVDRGGARTVFLVHGGGGRPEQFRGVIERLAAAMPKHNLVATTLYGHARSGRSAVESDFDTDELALDVEQEIDLFGTAGGTVLVGHSLGSALVTRLWARADALVLLGSAESAPAAARSPLLHCCYCFLDAVRPLLGRLSSRMLYGPAAGADLVAREREVTSQNPWPTVCGLARGLRWPDARPVACPTLLLHGRADGVTPLAGAREVARRVRGSRLVVLDRSGHNLMLEEPARVSSAMIAFLAEVGMA